MSTKFQRVQAHNVYQMRIGQQRYGVPDDEWVGSGSMLDERKFTVGPVLGEQIKTFAYRYDFGDGWHHRITVEERLPVQEGHNDWPMCLAGENACPPEDVGGPPGYMGFPAGHARPEARAARRLLALVGWAVRSARLQHQRGPHGDP